MYIKNAVAISPQHSVSQDLFNEPIEVHNGNKYFAIEPSYADMIPRALLRRMNKAVRMGVGAGLMVLDGQKSPDGIILGTANGGIDDSFKFLHQILEYEEGTLTPTNFVQSTPNAVAGSLAMMTKNTGYNNTHVNYGLAFEAALLDAMMLFEEGRAKSLLVGTLEEISDHNFNMDLQAGWFKEENSSSIDLLNSGTKGTVKGEGSAMFIVDEHADGALSQILSVDQMNHATQDEVMYAIQQLIVKFDVPVEDLSFMIGVNGDTNTDQLYNQTVLKQFPSSTIYSFKNLVGEYPTATGFALFLSTKILNNNSVPDETVFRSGDQTNSSYILIYNHYKEIQHSLILLKKCR